MFLREFLNFLKFETFFKFSEILKHFLNLDVHTHRHMTLKYEVLTMT